MMVRLREYRLVGPSESCWVVQLGTTTVRLRGSPLDVLEHEWEHRWEDWSVNELGRLTENPSDHLWEQQLETLLADLWDDQSELASVPRYGALLRMQSDQQ
jgi:hypothetical protein